jgi:hypothetical protein
MGQGIKYPLGCMEGGAGTLVCSGVRIADCVTDYLSDLRYGSHGMDDAFIRAFLKSG